VTITKEQFDELVSAVRAIAHGSLSGPTGLEMLAMSFAGEGLRTPIGPALESLATAVREHAEAVTNAAETIVSAIDLDDNGECMRAFRDACRAYVNSKES
jgi:hypothetical protein